MTADLKQRVDRLEVWQVYLWRLENRNPSHLFTTYRPAGSGTTGDPPGSPPKEGSEGWGCLSGG